MKYKILFIILSLFVACSPSCQPSPVYHEIVITNALDTIEFTFYYNNLQGKDTLVSVTRHYHPPTVPPTSTSSTFTPTLLSLTDPDVVASGRGANQFYSGNGSQTNLPGTTTFDYVDNDVRYTWWQLQPGLTTNFSQLDNDINTAIARGRKLSFRVTTCDAGSSIAVLPSTISSSKVPDFNSETYLANYISFISAMGAHLNSTGLIKGVYKIDIGGIGNWSEMHFFSLPTGTKPMTAANVKRIVDAYTSAFPNTWLMVTISGLTNNSGLDATAARYLLTAKNNLGPVGIRNDHLGHIGTFSFDNNPAKYFAIDFLPAIKDRYKTSPMGGELMNDLSAINSYSDLANETNTWHLSQFSNNNWCRNKNSGASSSQISASDANIRAASKISGYRISISKAILTIDSTGSHLQLTWVNSGNAPTYENWDVYIICGTTQIKSICNLKTLLPGTMTTTDNIPSGTYSLSVIIKDPTGVRKPFVLINTSRGTDGSYLLGSVKL